LVARVTNWFQFSGFLMSRVACYGTKSLRRSAVGVRLRSGLSLIEVMLALAILAGALAVLGHQASVGVNAALRSQLSTEAALKCQTQMETLLAIGFRGLPVSNQALPGHEAWHWSAELLPSELESVQMLRVSVYKPGGKLERLSRWTLTRLVRATPKDIGAGNSSSLKPRVR
jgi:prepilin-type N-terminal cleavage/methylation domain-containing protein